MAIILQTILTGSVLSWLINANYALPQFSVTGSHYEVGLQVGKQFKKQIQDYYNGYAGFKSQVVSYYNTPEGYKLCTSFLQVAEASYPDYVSELRGLALGAELPFVDVFLMNIVLEIQTAMTQGSVWEFERHGMKYSRLSAPTWKGLAGLRKPRVWEATHCTTVLVNHPSAILVGHNEDGDCLIKDHAYLLSATITDSRGYVVENFTAFAYPGVLPGNAFAFNHHGVFYTMNAVYTKIVLANHTGRYFLTRALLAAKNVSRAHQILTDKGYGTTYGFSINLGKLFITSDEQPQLWNFEVAPSTSSTESLVNSHKIKSSTSSGNYFHVNTYRRMQGEYIPRMMTSSVHRTRVLEHYPAPRSGTDVRVILGDTSDHQYPVYRTRSKTDPECTAATALFDVKLCSLTIYTGNPKNSMAAVYSTPLPHCLIYK